jgi:hypothetical protein
MQNISLAIQNFNNRVKQMNQSGSKQLVLNVDEARNLHSDIYALLANLAEAVSTSNDTEEVATTGLDGGGFK